MLILFRLPEFLRPPAEPASCSTADEEVFPELPRAIAVPDSLRSNIVSRLSGAASRLSGAASRLSGAASRLGTSLRRSVREWASATPHIIALVLVGIGTVCVGSLPFIHAPASQFIGVLFVVFFAAAYPVLLARADRSERMQGAVASLGIIACVSAFTMLALGFWDAQWGLAYLGGTALDPGTIGWLIAGVLATVLGARAGRGGTSIWQGIHGVVGASCVSILLYAFASYALSLPVVAPLFAESVIVLAGLVLTASWLIVMRRGYAWMTYTAVACGALMLLVISGAYAILVLVVMSALIAFVIPWASSRWWAVCGLLLALMCGASFARSLPTLRIASVDFVPTAPFVQAVDSVARGLVAKPEGVVTGMGIGSVTTALDRYHPAHDVSIERDPLREYEYGLVLALVAWYGPSALVVFIWIIGALLWRVRMVRADAIGDASILMPVALYGIFVLVLEAPALPAFLVLGFFIGLYLSSTESPDAHRGVFSPGIVSVCVGSLVVAFLVLSCTYAYALWLYRSADALRASVPIDRGAIIGMLDRSLGVMMIPEIVRVRAAESALYAKEVLESDLSQDADAAVHIQSAVGHALIAASVSAALSPGDYRDKLRQADALLVQARIQAQPDFKSAFVAYTHAISRAPLLATVWYSRAVAAASAGDLVSAQADAAHALELDPGYEPARRLLGALASNGASIGSTQ